MARQLPASKTILRGGFQSLRQLTTDSSNLSVARRPSLQQAVRQKTFCVNFSFFLEFTTQFTGSCVGKGSAAFARAFT